MRGGGGLGGWGWGGRGANKVNLGDAQMGNDKILFYITNNNKREFTMPLPSLDVALDDGELQVSTSSLS